MSARQHGTKVFYAADNAAWVALAAGSYPGAGYTEVTRIVSTEVTPQNMEEYDDAPLGATAPEMEIDIKPGAMSFTKDKVGSETATLRGFCDGSTLKLWAFVYRDGTADTCVGKLMPGTVTAQRGDYKARVPEQYRIQCETSVTHRAAA
jgi:hypothetical protein